MKRSRAIALSLLSSVALVAMTLLLSNPLLRSGDDAYVMYQLSGAFGGPPDPLHGYQHLWHYLLAAPVSKLFSFFPGINWYTAALMAAVVAGGTAMGAVFLKRLGAWGWAPFLILLLFFGTSQVLQPTFTGVALWLAAGGAALLYHELESKPVKGWGAFAPAFLLLLLAGLLRLHVTGLVLVLFTPLLGLCWRFPGRWKAATMLAVLAGSLLVLFSWQQSMYLQRDGGWREEEGYRQAFFIRSNRPVVEPPAAGGVYRDRVEAVLHTRHFLYDTAYFGAERLRAINSALVRRRTGGVAEDRASLYWIFMESRLYLLLLLGVCIPVMGARFRRRAAGAVLLFFLLLYAVLFFWFKITTVLHLGFLFLLHLQVLLLLPAGSLGSGRARGFAAPLLLAALLWKGVHLRRERDGQALPAQQFYCLQEALAKHPQALFVATDDALPLPFFPVEQPPGAYPITNLLNRDRAITFTAEGLLRRWNGNIWQALTSEGVYLVGPPLPELEELYRQQWGRAVRLSAPLPGFGCLSVRRLSVILTPAHK